MAKTRSKADYGIRKYKGRTFLRVTLFFIVVFFIAFLAYNAFNSRNNNDIDRDTLIQLWASNSFEELYTLCGEQLQRTPLNYFVLTVHGFSAYQMAIAQINNYNMLKLIDDCIWSLRKALLFKEGANDGRLLYVLGKAYFYKGAGYGDLAVTYLEKAVAAGYDEQDIPEYLGMAYISVKDYRNSVAAFSKALYPVIPGRNSVTSDTLLLSIAGSYIALGEDDTAYAYLMQCLDISMDSDKIISARLYLGDILSRRNDFRGAEQQYTRVIEESGGNAEAYYRLGELFNNRGETVRARAEWRRAIQIDPSHRAALSRLNLLR